MDLNGDGRVGGGYGHAPPPNAYGQPCYPPAYNQYGGSPYPQNYGAYGGGCPPPMPQMNQYGAPGYGGTPHHGSGGGGFMNQIEKMTHMDLNGDGRVGGGASGGYNQPYQPYNQYGHPY